jgi:hypothetical protein
MRIIEAGPSAVGWWAAPAQRMLPALPRALAHRALPAKQVIARAAAPEEPPATGLRLPWLWSSSPAAATTPETTPSPPAANATSASKPPLPLPLPLGSLDVTEPAVPTPDRPILSIAGGGRFFFWYLGVLKYMIAYYDLSKCTLIGASAGGLACVLAASGVDLDRAVREAYRLSVDNDVFERPAGLAGIWGRIVREWLDELLPDDAEERCAGRVKLVVTEALTFRLRYIEDFTDRDDLINAAMATVHIPFFLDFNATCIFRGQRYIDGSLFDFFSGQNSNLIQCSGAAVVVDYFFDDTLEFERLDFMKLSDYEEVKELVRKGYAYGQRTDAAGGFEAMLGSTRKSAFTLALEFPKRQLQQLFSET